VVTGSALSSGAVLTAAEREKRGSKY
jgi:hypothetical protein